MNESEFILRLQNGDQAAFAEMVDQFKNRVFNTAIGILQNTEDAEDISQEVFVEIFRSVKGFHGDSKLSTWTYRITVTKCLEFLRMKKRKKRFAYIQSLFSRDSVLPLTDQPHFFHPGVALENKERAEILFKAIDQLPENQKATFLLHKTEGLSYQEIGDVLGVSVASVESLMHRAKQNLRKLLGDYFEKNER